MNRKIFIGLVALLAVNSLLLAEQPAYRPGAVLVRFANEPNATAKSAILNSALGRGGSSVEREYTLVKGLTQVSLPADVSVENAVASLKQSSSILYAEPDYRIELLAIPNDTRFGELWGMRNTGQFGGIPGADIKATEAWDISTGNSTIIVAVSDTGVDYNHPDLASNMWHNPGEIPGNGIDDDGNGYIDDVYGCDNGDNDGDPMDNSPGGGHGTHVAGTIGAVGNNAIGVTGVCWNVRIMALKISDSNGGPSSWNGWVSNAVAGIQYSVSKGARVINASWRAYQYSQNLYDAIASARDAGVIFVAAAGNENINNDSTPDYPASYDLANIISVMATTDTDHRASFSNYGLTTVDLGAPGQNIVSTLPGNQYDSMDGTSMASPHVAGACALLLSIDPTLNYSQVKQILLGTVDPTLAGFCVSGGRLNLAAAAQEAAMDSIPPTPDTAGWLMPPTATGLSTISMEAINETDRSNVEYYFECVNDVNINSGWVPNALYTFFNKFNPGSTHGFRVKARDKSANHNETAWSNILYATTCTGTDILPPAPSPAQWAIQPKVIRPTPFQGRLKIKGKGTDESGPEQFRFKYYDILNPSVIVYDSGWLPSADGTFQFSVGIQLNHTYGFNCNVRDNPGNETGWSEPNVYVTLTTATGPRILRVPSEYLTIQSAIDAANPGDIVEVSPYPLPPYYYQGINVRGLESNINLRFRGKAITVRSTDPENPDIVARTIIDCNGPNDFTGPRRAFIFDNGEGPDSIVAGFTIRNAYVKGHPGKNGDANIADINALPGRTAAGGAILCGPNPDPCTTLELSYTNWGTLPGSPTIRNCVFINCIVDGGDGGLGADGNDGNDYQPGDANNPSQPAMPGQNAGNGGSSGAALGGAIYCSSGSNPVIKNCTITGCSALSGLPGDGGDGGNGGTDPNTGQQPGGNAGSGADVNSVAGAGICAVLGSNPTIIGCNINDCNAHVITTFSSAGVPGAGNPPGLPSYYYPNFGQAYGGGVYYETINAAVNISSTSFARNRAQEDTEGGIYKDGYGGGIFVDVNGLATTTMTDCNFTENSADTYGGGIIYAGIGKLVLQNCKLTGNTAIVDGGGLAGWFGGAGTFEAYNSDIGGNAAGNANSAGYGGGFYLDSTIATIEDCNFNENQAQEGGAIVGINCQVDIHRSGITGNSAVAPGGTGGGLALWNTTGQVTDCILKNNSAAENGGAVFAEGWTIQPLDFSNCLITDNIANFKGGGLSNNVGTWMQLNNCTVARNSVTNQLYGTGGGVSDAGYFAWIQIVNSILWDNSAAHGPQIAVGSIFGSSPDPGGFFADVDVSYSDVEGGEGQVFIENPAYTSVWWLDGNFDADPLFVNVDINQLTYYLSQKAAGQLDDSPCVDRGSDTAVNLGMDTLTTRTDHVHDAGTVDIGYHYNVGSVGSAKKYPLSIEVYEYDPNEGGHGRLNAKTTPQNDTQFDINDPNTIQVNQGTIVNLTATPDPGYRVQWWSGTNDDTSTAVTNTVTMNSVRKVIVAFEPNGLYYLTVTVIGNGTVFPSGRTLQKPGEVVTLTASPFNPSDVIAWTGTDNDYSQAKTNTVTMNGHRNVTVEFYSPRILYVGADSNYPTIQLAIDDANPHDIVIITPGTYNIYESSEDLPYLHINKDIRLTSTSPGDPGATTIIGGFVIENTSRNLLIEGLTIRDARYWKDYEAGVLIGEQNPLTEWTWATPQGAGVDGRGGGTCRGAGMQLNGAASPTVRNCQFVNCLARGIHGATGAGGLGPDGYSGNGGPGGKAFGGGAYCGVNGSPLFDNCSFINCTAQAGDAGNGGSAAPSNGGHGGAWGDNEAPWWNEWNQLYGVYYGTLEEFWKYSGYGGAIYCDVNSTAEFRNCTFTGNSAMGSSCGISGASIPSGWPSQHYKIESFGGAVYAASGSAPQFIECDFINNEANMQGPPTSRKDNVATVNAYPNISFGGAAAFEDGATPVFERCMFNGNRATIGGGAFAAWAYGTVTDCDFEDNSSYSGGGILYVGGTSEIINSRFTGNQSTVPAAQGGAITLLGANAEIIDCNISRNQTAGQGGGIYVSSKDIKGLDVDGNNTVLIKNCLLAHNAATQGGGGISATWYSDPNIVNCTIANNSSLGGLGGGLYCTYNNYTRIFNSIVWGNSAVSGSEIAVGVVEYPSVVDIYYSDVNRATGTVAIDAGSVINWNAGVINADPLFTSAADYYLGQIAAGQSANSPCVNAGSDFASRFGLHKYTTRTDGERDTGIVDMGYHYPMPFAGCLMFDYTGDEKVNFEDLAKFALFWLNEGCSDVDGWCQGRDLTFDGAVDIYDLGDFSLCWLYTAVQSGGGDTTPPTPNPMQWAILPAPVAGSSVTMAAATATDDGGGPVWYEFQETTGNAGGTSSGWQTSSVYTDTGLQGGIQYCYRVRARDEFYNITDWSEEACLADVGDVNAPVPNPMTWAIAPRVLTGSSVEMRASTAVDSSGQVYYQFDQVGGLLSAWQTDTYYVVTGLNPTGEYCFRVRARDQYNNTTAWSEPACVSDIADIGAPTPPIFVPVAASNIARDDPNTASGQFMWDPANYQWDWWHRVIIDVTSVADNVTPTSELEVRFICSNSRYSSDNVIPAAFRPIRIGHPVAIGARVIESGQVESGYRLTWNGTNQIVYDVYVEAVGGSYGKQLSWHVCVYDASGNSACTATHMIPQ